MVKKPRLKEGNGWAQRLSLMNDTVDGWMASWTQMNMSLSKLLDVVKDRGLVCYSPWGHKTLDMTKQLKNNKTDRTFYLLFFFHTQFCLIIPAQPIHQRKAIQL